MTDIFTKKKRSEIMSRVRQTDTSPELVVRSTIHKLGYRFRLHDKTLPGRPDIVLKRHGKIVFVHGCFWHGHKRCKRSRRPSTNKTFWDKKLDANTRRDKRVRGQLYRQGWKTLTVWECETHDVRKLGDKLKHFLADL